MRTIEISLPQLSWKLLLRPRVLLLAAVLGCVGYWYFAVRPYLCVENAHVAAVFMDMRTDRLGRLAAAPQEEGTIVQRGDVLFVLSSDDDVARQRAAQTKVETLKRMLNEQNAEIDKVMQDYLNVRTEIELGLSQEMDSDAPLAMLQQTQLQIAETQKRLGDAENETKLMQLQIEKNRALAPFSGVIAERCKREGEIVQPGESVVRLCDASHPWIEAMVPESKLQQIRIGQSAEIRIPAQHQRWMGQVTHIAPVAIPGQGIAIRIDPISGAKVLPGLTAHVKIRIH